jgi:hypothetical protein
MPYDIREAQHLLAAAHAKKYQHLYTPARRAAAASLVDDVMALVKALRIPTHVTASGMGSIKPNPHASGKIELVSDEDGVHVHFAHVTANGSASADIEFDAGTGQWVGKSVDTFLVPIPGQPRPQRSAAAVVVDLIIQGLQRIP